MQQLKDRLKLNTSLSPSKSVIVHILFSNSGIKEALSAPLKDFDLSLEQFNVLRILRGQKGESLHLQDISNRMVTKSSNTTRLVNKLVDKSYIVRETSKTNRRKINISITQKGIQVLNIVDPLIDEAESNITKTLNDNELKELTHLLSELNI